MKSNTASVQDLRWQEELKHCALPCMKLVRDDFPSFFVQGRLEIFAGEIIWLKELPFKQEDFLFLDILVKEKSQEKFSHVGTLCGRHSKLKGDSVFHEQLSFPVWSEASMELYLLVSCGPHFFHVSTIPLKNVFSRGRTVADACVCDTRGDIAGVVDLVFDYRKL